MGEKRGLLHSLNKWANTQEIDARDLQEANREAGCACVAEAADRVPVRLRGQLRTVTLRPRGGVPALEADLFDGSGSITIVWLGRRRIVGIEPGRSIEVTGRIGVHDGVRIIYNPRYELL
ncbi:OB-fold nucleic acid binding domain-containing protein [Nocardioides ultimimeridianus]